MLTAHQIIDEEIEFRKVNPRSLNKWGTCAYRGQNGSKCAVSLRCYDDVKFVENKTISQLHAMGAEIKFLPQYQGHSISFWQYLQDLHDADIHWNEGFPCDLTRDGEDFVRAMKERFKP